jgi:hypothetical protein
MTVPGVILQEAWERLAGARPPRREGVTVRKLVAEYRLRSRCSILLMEFVAACRIERRAALR